METRQLKTNYSKSTANNTCEMMTAKCVTELMNAAVSYHKLHLKVNGAGSFAAHKALNEIYDSLPGFADSLAEGYQGASETLLSYTESAPKTLNSVNDGVSYARELTNMITNLQKEMCYSEIVNELDLIKSALASLKYKLLFLK